MNRLILSVIAALSLTSCASFWTSDVESKTPYIRTASFMIARGSLANSKYSEKSIETVKNITLTLKTLTAQEALTPEDLKIELSDDAEVNASLKNLVDGIYVLYKGEFDKIKDGKYKNLAVVLIAISEGLEMSTIK